MDMKTTAYFLSYAQSITTVQSQVHISLNKNNAGKNEIIFILMCALARDPSISHV